MTQATRARVGFVGTWGLGFGPPVLKCDAGVRRSARGSVCSAARKDTTGGPNEGAEANALPVRVGGLVRCAGVALVGLAAVGAVVGTQSANAYGLVNGRLEKCRGDMPCISTTSVGNPSKFGPPWSYQPETDDVNVAWQSLKRAVEENKDKGKTVESMDGPEEYYLRAEFPSSFKGIDDVEFRLLKKDSLVTYRSASREALFVYPLQTPINIDKNKTRLLDIRQKLGWEEFAGFNVFGTKFKE